MVSVEQESLIDDLLFSRLPDAIPNLDSLRAIDHDG
jgi:hypothetical protein